MPASPCTRRTAWPSATSTAGRSVRVMREPYRARSDGTFGGAGGRSARVASQLRSSSAPASPDFSGWNWVAHSGPFSTAATNGSPCSAQVTSGGSMRPVGSGSRSQRARRRSARSRSGRPRRGRRTARCPSGRLDGVPAHVRHDRRLEPVDRAGPLVAALGVDAVLDAPLEQDLHADADAEHRAAAGEPAADDLVAADAAQPCHARGERADARARPGRRRPARRRSRR